MTMIDIDLLITWGASFKEVAKGTIIFSEGQMCSFYHQLVSGSVRWVSMDDNGKEFIQKIIGPGESFGELPLFDDDICAATAIAVEKSVILRLHKPTFLLLLKEYPSVSISFSRLLAQRVRFDFMQLKSLAFNDPESRISILLNYFKQENKNFCGNCHQLKLTRQQIAGMTGLRVETVIRSMRHMHDRGELLIDKGKVYC
jgi:CRP-like cAMP-binding protein